MWSLHEFLLDLKTLNRKIDRFDIPINKKQLIILESDLEGRNINEDISHILKDIEFTLDECISGTIPNEVYAFNFLLSVNFILNPDKDFLTEDPFYNDKIEWKNDNIDSYSLQLEINAYSNEHDEPLYNCWHLDRHITGGGQAKVQHPFYHFQNGGNKMSIYNNHLTVAVFTGAPRIPHPPMDLFLAFHFVLNNFYNKNSSKNIYEILNDDDYIEIIEKAQERMWKPYYSAYNGSQHTDYTINNITPLYTIH